jgi:hypothetical protein
VYILDDQEYFELTYARTVKVPLQLPYSYSGSTQVLYSLSLAPSWVSIDSNTGVLTVETGQATIGTVYEFMVGTAVSVGLDWIQWKIVRLKVAE